VTRLKLFKKKSKLVYIRMDYAKVISESRPTLKERTIRSYVSILKKVDKDIPGWTDMGAEDLVEAINNLGLKDVTKRNKLTAMLVVLSALDNDKYSSKLNLLRKVVWEKNDAYQSKNNIKNNHLASENQQKNIISYKQLVKYVNSLRNDIDTQQKHMIFVILQSLVSTPVRNDLAGMIYIGKREFNKIDPTKEQNYLLVDRDRKLYYIYYQDDSTTKTRPKFKQLIPPTLARRIRHYIKTWNINKGDVLYPISKNNLSQVLTKTSQKYLNKNIGTTLIRKIVASHKFQGIKESVIEQEELAENMGHSVSTQNAVYNKQIPV